jgi:CRAL/TRIO domain
MCKVADAPMFFSWVADVKIEMFSHTPFLDEGGLFVRNRDKDGKIMLIFRVKTHAKGQHNMDDLKKFVIYWFERLERYTTHKKKIINFSLFFS